MKLGLSPLRMDELYENVRIVRMLLAGEEVDAPPPPQGDKKAWGVETKMRLLSAQRWGRGIPVEIAVMSPKAATKWAEIVDGHMGGNAEGVTATVGNARSCQGV